MQEILEPILRIYRDAAHLFERVKPSLGEAPLNYEILYGPPVLNPPILFVGYQPGGHKPEPLPRPAVPGQPPPWPTAFDFAKVGEAGEPEKPFLLARRLQVAFTPDFLAKCTGMNAIFLRARTIDAYQKMVPAVVRAEYEAFGIAATREIINLLQPRIVVAMAFATMKLFAPDDNVVLKGDAGALLSVSEINGIPFFGMRHPTGSIPPTSNADMKRIGVYLLDQLETAS